MLVLIFDFLYIYYTGKLDASNYAVFLILFVRNSHKRETAGPYCRCVLTHSYNSMRGDTSNQGKRQQKCFSFLVENDLPELESQFFFYFILAVGK